MISCRLILETVSVYYRIPVRDLDSQHRPVDFVHARHMAWFLARELTDLSYPAIGLQMGGRDHTSILHGVRLMRGKIIDDAAIAQQFDVLRRSLIQSSAVVSQAGLQSSIDDPDALVIANRMLNQPIRDMAPSMHEIRSMAMAVCVYASELANAHQEATELAGQVAVLTGDLALVQQQLDSNSELERIARETAFAGRDLERAVFSPGEKAARARLDRCLLTLRNHFAQEKAYA